MPEVLGEVGGLFVEGTLYRGGGYLVALPKTLAVKKLHLGGAFRFLLGLLGAMQGFEHLLYGRERPIDAAFLQVFQSLGNALFYNIFRRENNLVSLALHFNDIAGSQAQFVMKLFGDSDLPTCTDARQKRPRRFGFRLCFHIFV